MISLPLVTIWMLGDQGCGKATFIARLQGEKSDAKFHDHPSTIAGSFSTFDVSFFARPYTFRLHHISGILSVQQRCEESPPDFVVYCFDISDRVSLENVRHAWHKQVRVDENVPKMLLGLKRDLRRISGPGDFIPPEEAYNIAQEIDCDRYAECSAVTGELMREVVEDITRTAAMKTTARGGRSNLCTCTVM